MDDGSVVSAMSFEDILAREDYVLSDTETHNVSGLNWYADFVYPAVHYSEIDLRELSSAAGRVALLRRWFSEPAVHAVPNVVAEVSRFSGILHDKLTMLNRFERTGHKSSNKDRAAKRRKRKLRGRFERRSSEAKGMFEGICFDYMNIHRSAQKGVFRPESPEKFGCIERKVRSVAERTGAKRDNRGFYGRLYTDCEDLHADEQIVAAALYRSLCEGCETAIVTPDSDIARILVNVYHGMKSERKESAEAVSFSLSRFPVRLYFVRHDAGSDEHCVKLLVDSAEHLDDVDYLQDAGLALAKRDPFSGADQKGFYIGSVSD